MLLLAHVVGPLAITLAVLWLSRPFIASATADHGRGVVTGLAIAQSCLYVVALLLFPLMPEEGNRQGGT